ncbi:MAG: LytTR family transcriptional regulator [Bacteroidetes bacterium]|nr:LytTR family transcriptional regulator [Bacteroidota bacterium]
MPKKIPHIALRSGNCFFFVREEDIIYLKAEGAYTDVHLYKGQVITISKKIKEVEEQLTPGFFFRIHNSYVVNLHHIISYKRNGGNTITLSNNEILSLARSRKAMFFQMFRKL